jgi:hypothetical protein
MIDFDAELCEDDVLAMLFDKQSRKTVLRDTTLLVPLSRSRARTQVFTSNHVEGTVARTSVDGYPSF